MKHNQQRILPKGQSPTSSPPTLKRLHCSNALAKKALTTRADRLGGPVRLRDWLIEFLDAVDVKRRTKPSAEREIRKERWVTVHEAEEGS